MQKLSKTIRDFFECGHTLNVVDGMGNISHQAELTLDLLKEFATHWVKEAESEVETNAKRWPVCSALEYWLNDNTHYVKLKDPITYSEFDAVGPAPQDIHDVMRRLFYVLYPGRSTMYPFAPSVIVDGEDRTCIYTMREFYCTTNDNKTNHLVPMRVEFINAILEA